MGSHYEFLFHDCSAVDKLTCSVRKFSKIVGRTSGLMLRMKSLLQDFDGWWNGFIVFERTGPPGTYKIIDFYTKQWI